nr:hypothetical protein GCM10025732_14590 [Glycomyces mayteni]
MRRSDYHLEYSCFLPVEGLDADAVRVGAVRLPDGAEPAPAAASTGFPEPDAAAATATAPDGTATVATARLPLEGLAGGVGKWALRASVRLGAHVYDLPLKAPQGYVRREGSSAGSL